MKKLACLALALLAGCAGAPEDALTDFTLKTPRPFGYVLGDELAARIVFETRPGLPLDAASLPAEGPVNRWLNLKRLDLRQEGGHYEIELNYQVFYAPLAVKTLTVPGFELRFGSGDAAFAKAVPSWQFSVSPLRDPSVQGQGASAGLRPDSPPPRFSARSALTLIAAGFGVALSAAACLGLLYGALPWLGRRTVFKQALKGLARCSERDMADALRLLHRALNQLHRQPLFERQLPEFYRRHPEYRGADGQLRWFFNYSNHYFFSRNVSATRLDFEKLVALCTACRHIERGSR